MSFQLLTLLLSARAKIWRRVITVLTCYSLVFSAHAQPDTLAPVSEALVRHHLERSLSVQELASTATTTAQRTALFDWAGTAGLRLAGRVGGWWASPPTEKEAETIFNRLRSNCQQLHARVPDAVVQGCLFEVILPTVDNFTIPNRMRATFGEDTLRVPSRHFRFADMMYPAYFDSANANHYRWDQRLPGAAPGVPDLSRVETQLWFYYCAARQIDAGCEALHFGQIRLMDDRDPGHRAIWSLMQRIRRYARTRNRGFVLCDAHTHGEYYDPHPDTPLPDSVRQLLFDFHSTPLRPEECDTTRGSSQAAYLTLSWRDPEGGGIYRVSRGGRAPGGWLCRHLPAQAEFDNGLDGVHDKPNQWPLVWGRDEISWYANQPSAYRSKWLIYANARVRQLDPDTYFQPAGARWVELPSYPHNQYWATEGGQAETIRAIWAGETQAEAEALLLVGPPKP